MKKRDRCKCCFLGIVFVIIGIFLFVLELGISSILIIVGGILFLTGMFFPEDILETR